MIMKIQLTVGNVTLEGELNDSPTARNIGKILPIKSGFNTWGEEFYFSIPVEAPLDDTARETVNLGDLGYWPAGNAFCVFFGQTPMSTRDEIVPASAVNVIGRLHGDVTVLKGVMNEKEIAVEEIKGD
jgi:hypothetical protein